ncbi:MAG: LytTR family transcriptional regulator DNA-binding domain-containing protein [Lysobacteraceae bacterium]
MRTLIVDDTRLARAELRTLLTDHPQIEIVAEAEDVAGAIEAIDRLQPALLLLDIQLPGGTGFDVLAGVEHLPQVIFTTAYDQYAVEAFQRNALDYLLKPIEPERLRQALARASERLNSERSAPAVPAGGLLGAQDTVFLRDGERCWFVALRDISHMVVDGNYVRVHFGSEKALLNRSLSALEARLEPNLFFRANRNALVNLRAITQIDPWVNDGYRLRLRDGQTLEVSRRQARELRERLSL